MSVSEDQMQNRIEFLEALRSGQYHQGEIIKGGDEKEGSSGSCVIGLAYMLFCNNKGSVTKGLKDALGLTPSEIYMLQNEWNDEGVSFTEIADKLEGLDWKPPGNR